MKIEEKHQLAFFVDASFFLNNDKSSYVIFTLARQILKL